MYVFIVYIGSLRNKQMAFKSLFLEIARFEIPLFSYIIQLFSY